MDIEKAQQFCDKWLAAWTGNRPDSLIKFYAKNCLYVDPANPRGLKGHPEILPYFTKLLAANPTWEWKMDKLFPILNGFILKWNARIPVGSKIISISGMDIVKIEGKKIIRNEVYFDRTSWLRAIRDQ